MQTAFIEKLKNLTIKGLPMFLGLMVAFLSVESTSFAKKAKTRDKFLTREAKTSTKKGDKTKVDFDEVDIGGQRKTPFGTLVNNNRLKKDYDFIKLRQRWHPEMIDSASNLESGGR